MPRLMNQEPYVVFTMKTDVLSAVKDLMEIVRKVSDASVELDDNTREKLEKWKRVLLNNIKNRYKKVCIKKISKVVNVEISSRITKDSKLLPAFVACVHFLTCIPA
jgi:hypothetical protein